MGGQDRELGLITGLCRELVDFGLKNVGLSDARPAVVVRTGSAPSLWISVDASLGFFEWRDAEERHPVTDPAGVARRVAEYVETSVARRDEGIIGTRTIPATPEQVGPVRHWLSALLAAEYTAIADDVVLLACELLTNAIRHSDSARPGADGEPGSVTLVVLDVGDDVRVEVIDAGSASSVPRAVEERSDALNGRGLYMLDVLCEGRWGHYTDGDGRTVWFEIAGERLGLPGEP